jgi:hypothetical protein
MLTNHSVIARSGNDAYDCRRDDEMKNVERRCQCCNVDRW